MWKVSFVLGCLVSLALAQWTCTQDSQCADVSGSVCSNGACVCQPGQQITAGGCVNLAPYHTSTCIEDHQCLRLLTSFECRRKDDTQEGACHCQAGSHYFLGRCWRSAGYGETCTHHEECIDVPRDPYSLQCDGTCVCADGYYERQRGECRKSAYAVGEACVLDQDCQFANGVCDLNSRTCELLANTATRISTNTSSRVTSRRADTTSPRDNVTSSVLTSALASRLHGSACVNAACEAPFECSNGACICPVGYYSSANGLACLAELGSTSTEAQCSGFLAEVIDGVCACPANFYYEENMRDCVKVSRRITDSCVTDENCHTFGAAALCGPPQDPWQLRSCECETEQAVWDSSRQMCRLFVGVGEACEVDSDCLAGDLDIQCVQGFCACPEGFLSVGGLCLTTGLDIGDACQASQECTATPNTACLSGTCACGDGYQLVEDYCAPIIGGTCILDSDCVIENTVCSNDNNVFTCQCSDTFVAHEEECWPVSLGFEESCNVTVQCTAVMGEYGACVDDKCICDSTRHFRDGNCWPTIGLFEGCSRTSECFLPAMSERVVCRNSLCQCDFDYPYSEQLQTCVSSATGIFGSVFVIATAFMYLVIS